MLSIVRKGTKIATQRLDRGRLGEQWIRSHRANHPSSLTTRRNLYSGSQENAYNRILEGLVGSATRNDKNDSNSWPTHPYESRKFSLDTTFNRPVVSAALHVPRSATSLDLPSPFLETLQCSISSPFPSRDKVGSPQVVPIGLGSRNSLALTAKRHPTDSRKFFSTDSQSQYKTSARIPTPQSSPSSSMFSLSSFDPKAIVKGLLETTWNFTKILLTFLVKLPSNTFYYLTHPTQRREKIQEIKGHAKKEFDHYWTGTKLLMADVRTARDLVRRTLSGSPLTRRERKQLLRTVSDLFRLVPFSMFLIIPLAEFALPFALRLFPNMLPSTFQDSLKAEENMKRELQSRIAMAHFFQETLEELAKEQKRIAAKRNQESPGNEIANKQEQSAASMLEFLDRARTGEIMPPDVIIQYAKYFQDDLTLDNMPRMQLVNMCRYMQLQPYGADSFLRFQLRHRIRQLKEDDQRIIWEGIDSLTKMELREACQERGMRSTGLSKEAYKKSLQQWLDLSVHNGVPISLLIMSRTFFLQEEIARSDAGDEAAKNVASLADAISGLDKEVLNEVILEVATKEEKKSNPDIRKIKLEVVTQQNERIREEREAAEKKKKSSEKLEVPPPESPVAAVQIPVELSSEQAEKLAQVLGVERSASQTDTLTTPEILAVPVQGTAVVAETTITVEEEKERELSPAEMDAISQLLSADPVSKEREDLARIKSAMADKVEVAEAVKETEPLKGNDIVLTDTDEKASILSSMAQADEQVSSTIEKIETSAALEAEKSTIFSQGTQPLQESIGSEREEEDPIVARLKKRLETMVDKIELQLSDVEVKIGDKLHILDKDADGVLTREEMAECLQFVLKRGITFDEAMEIAGTIDENKDGVFTVQELISWIQTNKLVKLESEGRDADMDRIMQSHSEAGKDDASKVVNEFRKADGNQNDTEQGSNQKEKEAM